MPKDKAILPISYFGPIEYYSLLHHYDCSIEVHENYQKRTVRNRARILSANGVITISVPLQKGKTLLPIKEVLISYDEPWVDHHIKTISSAYNSSPYFEYYSKEIFSIISCNYKTLHELNTSIMEYLRRLEIVDQYLFTSVYNHDYMPPIIDKRPTTAQWNMQIKPYIQVFEDKYGFSNNLSILDALFNLGPETRLILKQ